MRHSAKVEFLALWLLSAGVSNAGIESFPAACDTADCPNHAASPGAPPEAGPPSATESEAASVSIESIEQKSPSPQHLMRSAQPPNTTLRVEGYRDTEYVYGEMVITHDNTVEGFIYRPDGRKIYVYGQRATAGQIEAYDRQGRLLLLKLLE